jgi:hypothetical protein
MQERKLMPTSLHKLGRADAKAKADADAAAQAN